jgi:hypothetical protein
MMLAAALITLIVAWQGDLRGQMTRIAGCIHGRVGAGAMLVGTCRPSTARFGSSIREE